MNRFAIFFVYIALLVNALVPAGYMTAQAADGSITIRICDGLGNSGKTIASSDANYETYRLIYGVDESHEGEEGSVPCDMGASPAGHMPEAPAALEAILTGDMTVSVKLAVLSGIFPTGLPPSTGPPLS